MYVVCSKSTLKLLPEHCITAQIIELKITVVTTKMQITRQVYLFFFQFFQAAVHSKLLLWLPLGFDFLQYGLQTPCSDFR